MSNLWFNLRTCLSGDLWNSLRSNLAGSLRSHLEGSLRNSLADSLRNSLAGSLRNSATHDVLIWGAVTIQALEFQRSTKPPPSAVTVGDARVLEIVTSLQNNLR
jgi:hypothetical protein